jgi:hypothetical protein
VKFSAGPLVEGRAARGVIVIASFAFGAGVSMASLLSSMREADWAGGTLLPVASANAAAGPRARAAWLADASHFLITLFRFVVMAIAQDRHRHAARGVLVMGCQCPLEKAASP